MDSVNIVTPAPTLPLDVLPSPAHPQALTESLRGNPFHKMQAGTTSHQGLLSPDSIGSPRLFLDTGRSMTLLEDPCRPHSVFPRAAHTLQETGGESMRISDKIRILKPVCQLASVHHRHSPDSGGGDSWSRLQSWTRNKKSWHGLERWLSG